MDQYCEGVLDKGKRTIELRGRGFEKGTGISLQKVRPAGGSYYRNKSTRYFDRPLTRPQGVMLERRHRQGCRSGMFHASYSS
jgi:hypothetical protein